LNLFFTIHYPYHLKPAPRFHRGDAFEAEATVEGFQAFVNRRFLPWVYRMQHLLRIDAFALQLCISGTTLDLMQDHNAGALAALKELAESRNLSFGETTHYHSICSLFSVEEREAQHQLHRNKIQTLFAKTTVPLRKKEEGFHLSANAFFLAEKMFSLEKAVKAAGDKRLLHQWRLLQDKCYYLSDVHGTELRNGLTELEVLLLQKKLSRIRIRYPQHSLLL
jgi:hypothetical protein